MSDCPHVTLKRQNVGNFHWYKCILCGQKFQVEEWDGKMKVVYPEPASTEESREK